MHRSVIEKLVKHQQVPENQHTVTNDHKGHHPRSPLYEETFELSLWVDPLMPGLRIECVRNSRFGGCKMPLQDALPKKL